jgi:hypothetical protein
MPGVTWSRSDEIRHRLERSLAQDDPEGVAVAGDEVVAAKRSSTRDAA